MTQPPAIGVNSVGCLFGYVESTDQPVTDGFCDSNMKLHHRIGSFRPGGLMSENWERPGAIYALPSSATKYERLNREIDAPRVTEGSTVLFDYNRLSVRRRALWMKQNGLGLQESYPAFRPEFAS